ncbi:hypothetical protein HJC23_004862 [Cyclotella cryptica]|uniref:Uncharacterized protein n=1 Tax=Cyclotella cryptica TaxID=29204 RepID=A0ABD3P739_9STRA
MLFKTVALSAFATVPLATSLPGCYQAWRSGGTYYAGSVVSATRIIESAAGDKGLTVMKKNFKCISGSQASLSHCPTYDPSNTIEAAAAWSDLGQCNETSPVLDNSSSVAKANLKDVGGCPDEYVVSSKYEEGDRVVVEGIVYQCRSWPNSAFCSMHGFEPDGINSAQAWTLLGTCDGTIAPTSSPNFVSLPDAGGCPMDYSSDEKYEAGDKVSVQGNGAGKIVYECPSDVHVSRYCSEYEPGHWSKLGWKVVGHCDGTIAPSTSPIFQQLNEVGNGCPEEYNTATSYEAGDHVSFLLSEKPRKVAVYECKTWPYTPYCNAGKMFGPGSDNSNLGWALTGFCEGTISPTSSPVVFPESNCIWYNGTKPVVIKSWSEGSLSSYVSGTRVRVHNRIYQCKGYPQSLWCKMAAYQPEKFSYWKDAWVSRGTCDQNTPLVPPTKTTLDIEFVLTWNIECSAINNTNLPTAVLSIEESLAQVLVTELTEAQEIVKVYLKEFCNQTLTPLNRKLQAAVPVSQLVVGLEVSESGCEDCVEKLFQDTTDAMTKVTIDGTLATAISEKSGNTITAVFNDVVISNVVTINGQPSTTQPSKSPTKLPVISPTMRPSSSEASLAARNVSNNLPLLRHSRKHRSRLLESVLDGQSFDSSQFPFFTDAGDIYTPSFVDPSPPQDDDAFTVFYNLFIPKTDPEVAMGISIMAEQLGQVADALESEDTPDGSTMGVQKKGVVYYNLIGKSVHPDVMNAFCHALHPRLECRMTGYYEDGTEAVTLQDIHDFCYDVGGKSDKDVRVTYIHNKGSYHSSAANNNWRREMTNAVLHPQCLSPPDDQCNVCGTDFYTRFAFMFPGNMWTAKCSYVRNLLPPEEGGEYDIKKTESIEKFLKMRLYGALDSTLMEDRLDYFGLGRYKWEHWIGSHPSIQPCEMHKLSVSFGDMVYGKVDPTSDYEWAMGPRRDHVTSEDEEAYTAMEHDSEKAFREYYLLSGNLVKWFTLYGSSGIPREDSWVWSYFSRFGGDRWKELVMKYGNSAVDQMAMQFSVDYHSAYGANIVTRPNTFDSVDQPSDSGSPLIVFLHAALPGDDSSSSMMALKVQLDALRQAITLYYTFQEGDRWSAGFIDNYCMENNMSCHMLNETPATGRGETLVHLYNYCQSSPSSRVTYVTNQNSSDGSHTPNELQAYAAAAASKICLLSTDKCNVCGMEFNALPYQHFSGNSFTADCGYVNKLLPPPEFEEKMNKLAGDVLVKHLESTFTAEFTPFTPENLGMNHYSVEHWIGSHPDVKPCAVVPMTKSRSNGIASSSKHISTSLSEQRELSEKDSVLFREYFYLAGNLYRWKHLYGMMPSSDSWAWTWFPKGKNWKEGVSKYGSNVVIEFTSSKNRLNEGVPL